jgi:hypothetical protein
MMALDVIMAHNACREERFHQKRNFPEGAYEA